MYNILIVDSNSLSRIFLAEIIDKANTIAAIFQAEELSTALNILEEIRIDFIVINIPQTSDSVFLEKIQHLEYRPLIIILTAQRHLTYLQQIMLEAIYFSEKTDEKQLLPKTKKNIGKNKKRHNAPLESENVDKDRTGSNNNGKAGETIMLSTAIGFCPVVTNSILAIEKTQRNLLEVYTKERVLTEVRGTLHEIHKLCSDDFVFLNRQSIVNRTAIVRISTKTREVFLDIKDKEKAFSCSRDKMRDLITWFNWIKKA